MAKSTYDLVIGNGTMQVTNQNPPGVVKKVVAVPDDLGKRLAHFGLHQIDLQQAVEYLDELDQRGYPRNGGETICQALWHSALVALFKCFGNSNARTSLQAEDIYTDPEQFATFNYWKALRNKNVVHDDNDVTQAWVVAMIRNPGYEPPVDSLRQFARAGVTVGADNTETLRGLIERATEHVRAEADKEEAKVREALNAMTYEELDALPPVRVTETTDETIHETRTTPPK